MNAFFIINKNNLEIEYHKNWKIYVTKKMFLNEHLT